MLYKQRVQKYRDKKITGFSLKNRQERWHDFAMMNALIQLFIQVLMMIVEEVVSIQGRWISAGVKVTEKLLFNKLFA